jgi:Pao retrotransposon peptidase/Family of unknown function (DUF5641)/Integrase zinc binding domain
MREHNYLIKGDLMEMFHQVRIKDEDTDALRFLFRFENDEYLREFKMLVLPFGASCSPAISQFVKNMIANECENIYPEAAEVIRNSTYVDDVVKSVSDLERAKILPYEISEIMKTGGFQLLKINSNENQVIESLKNKLSENEKTFSNQEEEKLLGYLVNFNKDTISIANPLSKFHDEIVNGEQKVTKRIVLQVLMSIFDPIGFVQFITSKMKLLYHNICLQKIDWDEPIPDELQKIWKKNLRYLQQISNIEIPRTYCEEEYHKTQLIAFGDAGKDALCGVVYARFINENSEQLQVALIEAKTFINSKNAKRTIPELELQIAVNICKMVEVIKNKHTITFDEFIYFTDNQAVLEWIKNEGQKSTVYVHNRVKKINELSQKSEWKWIPTQFMVADLGTKESAMTEIQYENPWFLPKIFSAPERDWLTFEPTESCYTHQNTKIDNIFDTKKFNNFYGIIYARMFVIKLLRKLRIGKLLRTMAFYAKELKITENRKYRYKLRESEKLLKEEMAEQNELSPFQEALNDAIKDAQKDVYKQEMRTLKKGDKLPAKHHLTPHLPWIDKRGIMRIRTRLQYNERNTQTYGYDRIFPMVLPKDHKFTQLVILKHHQDDKHAFIKNTISKLRTHYFIPHARATVKRIIKQNCSHCMRYNVRPEVPLMADLPSERIAHHIPPFTFTIADIAGPVSVKISRNVTAKRYIFVYSCLTTRAIHLELIENLDTDSTLIALQNVINIRGAPYKIITDNGTNFKGAKNKLEAVYDKWNEKLLHKGLISQPILWTFGPARAPHMQGAVERMVGLVKKAMDLIIQSLKLRNENLTDFTLRAILMEVVGILNNRPLAPQMLDDIETLTPNSFLMMRTNLQEVPNKEAKILSLNKNWEEIRSFTAEIWKLWIKDYLPTILKREKWIETQEPLKEGDLVITIDTDVGHSWRLGRIIKIKTGSNDQVREVEVMLGKNKKLNKADLRTDKTIQDSYSVEKLSIVTRPAIAVAKIKFPVSRTNSSLIN